MQSQQNDVRSLLVMLFAGVGALLLIIGLFLDWYSVGEDEFESKLSGWNSFEITDLLLLALALAALGVATSRALRNTPRETRVLGIALAALVIVVVQLINSPYAGFGEDLEVGLEVGAWLAFAGTLVMVVGGAIDILRGIEIARRPAEPDTVKLDEPERPA